MLGEEEQARILGVTVEQVRQQNADSRAFNEALGWLIGDGLSVRAANVLGNHLFHGMRVPALLSLPAIKEITRLVLKRGDHMPNGGKVTEAELAKWSGFKERR